MLLARLRLREVLWAWASTRRALALIAVGGRRNPKAAPECDFESSAAFEARVSPDTWARAIGAITTLCRGHLFDCIPALSHDAQLSTSQ